MKKIGIMTSGGDAPGMNACTRALVRTAMRTKEIEVVGFRGGFDGILKEKFRELNSRSVSNIIHLGGTVLKTGRSKAFYTEEAQEKAAKILNENYFDGIIVNGGNGSMAGLHALSKYWDGQIIGIPGTIDNDIFGSDFSIGFDTAVNTALDAIDKIRDTATSHERAFIIEVMGRHAGFIALEVAIAGGAEEALLPEITTDLRDLSKRFMDSAKKGKRTYLVVLAEGAMEARGASWLKDQLESLSSKKWRLTIIGYIQRGGSPTARDRLLATKLGGYSVDCFVNGKSGVMVGEINQKLSTTPLEEVYSKKKPLDDYLLKLLQVVC